MSNKLEIKNYLERINILTKALKEKGADPSKCDHLIDIKRSMRRMIRVDSRENPVKVVREDEESVALSYKLYLDDFDYAEIERRGVDKKDYVYDYLWHNFAATVSQYEWSPTGLWFTSSFKVAHIKDNEYLVRECRQLDI